MKLKIPQMNELHGQIFCSSHNCPLFFYSFHNFHFLTRVNQLKLLDSIGLDLMRLCSVQTKDWNFIRYRLKKCLTWETSPEVTVWLQFHYKKVKIILIYVKGVSREKYFKINQKLQCSSQLVCLFGELIFTSSLLQLLWARTQQ